MEKEHLVNLLQTNGLVIKSAERMPNDKGGKSAAVAVKLSISMTPVKSYLREKIKV